MEGKFQSCLFWKILQHENIRILKTYNGFQSCLFWKILQLFKPRRYKERIPKVSILSFLEDFATYDEPYEYKSIFSFQSCLFWKILQLACIFILAVAFTVSILSFLEDFATRTVPAKVVSLFLFQSCLFWKILQR